MQHVTEHETLQYIATWKFQSMDANKGGNWAGGQGVGEREEGI